jgi:hypothetical protein
MSYVTTFMGVQEQSRRVGKRTDDAYRQGAVR